MINISEKKSATKRFDKNDMSAFEETSIIDYNVTFIYFYNLKYSVET